MHNNYKDYYRNEICPEIATFKQSIAEVGLALYLIQMANQILFLGLAYGIINFINPIKSFVPANALNLIVIAAVLIIKGALKDRLPKFTDDLIKGSFFYKLGLIANVKSFCFLVIANIIFIFIPRIKPKPND